MKCCCPACMTNTGTRQFSNTCCKCIPKRICVSIFPPEDLNSYCPCSELPEDDPYGPLVRLTLHLDCSEKLGHYSGSFICGSLSADQPIDLKFMFDRLTFLDGTSGCYFILESRALGYVPHDYPSPDTRLRLPMGGPYHDPDVMRSECVNAGDFEFVVNLGTAFPGCGDAIIKVAAADFMEQPRPKELPLPSSPCWCQCVQLALVYQGIETSIIACWDEYTQDGWHGIFSPSPGEHYRVKVFLESDVGVSPATLRLESDLGNGEAKEAICDCRPTMFAEWDLYENDAKISVACDRYAGCVDCKCFCRCMCFIYADPDNAAVVRACWDEYINGWIAVFDFYGETVEIQTRLMCDAETGITKMHIFTNIGAADPTSISCPDIAASWTITKANYDVVTITMQCDNCGHCSNLVDNMRCCPVPIPLILYATVTGSRSCLGDVLVPPVVTPCGSVTFPIAYFPNLPAGPPVWVGKGTLDCIGIEFSCDGDCVGFRYGTSVVEMSVVLPCGSAGGSYGEGTIYIFGMNIRCTIGPSGLPPDISQQFPGPPGGTCNPVYAVGQITFNGKDPACSDCGVYTFDVVVTE